MTLPTQLTGLFNKEWYLARAADSQRNNVWIGDNVIILPGVKIGHGVVIGAGSIISKDIPAFSIAVGTPAKSIKKRFNDDIIKELLKIKWWDWNMIKIKQNKEFFNSDLLNISVQKLNSIIK